MNELDRILEGESVRDVLEASKSINTKNAISKLEKASKDYKAGTLKPLYDQGDVWKPAIDDIKKMVKVTGHFKAHQGDTLEDLYDNGILDEDVYNAYGHDKSKLRIRDMIETGLIATLRVLDVV